MKKALFDELIESVKEAGRIHRGEAKPSRTFVFAPEDVRQSRETRTDDRCQCVYASKLGAGRASIGGSGAGAARRCGCRRCS
jgi:hypothetical protein